MNGLPAPPKVPTKSRRRRARTVLLVLLGLFVLSSVAGAFYEWYAVRRDARAFAAPGQFVDVGRRRLHLVCIGSGSPVVLFEMSGFSNSTSFGIARTAIAGYTRVCTYDRMGIGWSDPGPSRISAGMLVDDLHHLLDAISEREPIIIVAASIGGLTAELFARRHPERVAGLVFLDAANSEALARLSSRRLLLAAATCSAAGTAGTVGLIRLLDPWDLRGNERSARSAALMYGAKPWVMLCSMVRAARTTQREFAAAPPLRRELPVTALSADTRGSLLPPGLMRLPGAGPEGIFRVLRDTHQHLAQGSARGTWKVIPGSDHLIASSQPQSVVDAVLAMTMPSGTP